VMAQWYSPCLGPWDLKKVYGFKPQGWWLRGVAHVCDGGTSKKCSRFKPRGDGSMAYSPCLGLDELQKGFGFKLVLVEYLLLHIPNRQGIFKKFTCDLGARAAQFFLTNWGPLGIDIGWNFFYKMGMGKRYQNWWCPGDLNLGMCIKKYDHNSYGFQAKIK
jgi:hypothetical protein